VGALLKLAMVPPRVLLVLSQTSVVKFCGAALVSFSLR